MGIAQPMKKEENILALFDVDGTLTPSRDMAQPSIIHMLKELRKRVRVAFVGGSDLPKQQEQIGPELLDIFDYGFPQNGLEFYKNGKLVKSCSIIEYLGEDTYKSLVNKILLILSRTECPVKRGTFIELRSSMVNVSPIGRSCSREERNQFFEYDKQHKIREAICKEIDEEFKDKDIVTTIGGQVSIDIYPKGWDKTYCLNHIHEKKIFFFGDMTMEGGNDHTIFNHERVIGYTVGGPDDTIIKVNEMLKSLGIEEIQ